MGYANFQNSACSVGVPGQCFRNVDRANLANRCTDQSTNTSDDLLGDQDSLMLAIVQRLYPVRPRIVSAAWKGSRSAA